MIGIFTLRNGRVIQGICTPHPERESGKDKIVFNVKTRQNTYEISLEECKKILFKESHDNKKSGLS